MSKNRKPLPFAPLRMMTDGEIARVFREYKTRYESGEFPESPVSTTPEAITQEIVDLCRLIDPANTPIYVPVRAVAEYTENFCFPNVEAQVAKHGGKLRCGWTIWEMPKRMIEAEFHGVWESPLGELIDLTKKSDQETRILFLLDSTRIYQGKTIENFRKALANDAQTELQIRFERAKYHYEQRDFAARKKIMQLVV